MKEQKQSERNEKRWGKRNNKRKRIRGAREKGQGLKGRYNGRQKKKGRPEE
jgi:hypothetical protein